MNKLFKSLMAGVFILAMCFVFTGPAHAGYDHYVINVYKDTGFATAAGGYTPITSDVRYAVFNGGTLALATLYSDSNGTAKTNPVESTTFEVLDRIDFYLADTVTSTDIAIMTLDGYALFLRGVTPSTRTAIIDQRPGIIHHSFMDYSVYATSQNALTGGPTDYWTLPSDVLLMPDVGLEPIIEAYSSQNLIRVNVGGTGAPFGLGGYFDTDDAYFYQAASGLYGVAESATYGSLFVNSNASGEGNFVSPMPYLLEAAATVGFEFGSCPDWTGNASDTADGWGFFHFWFVKLR